MRLSPLWHRAALLGSAWAALELIAGSFLHNIRFPLAGTVLAALGVVLLVAGRTIWNERGLLWRAGVICALMKSLSPSAVIIGPMAGIMLESLVMEAATRLPGPSLPALLIGGAVMTSLPLVQKAAGLLVTYGADVARLYAAMVESAAGSLGLSATGPAELLAALLAASMALGMAAALVGRRLARATGDAARQDSGVTRAAAFDLDAVDPAQRFSAPFLALHLVLIAAGLAALRMLPLLFSLALVLAYLAACLFRYPRLARRLGRVRLWMEFLLVTLLAGFFLGAAGSPGLSVAGLEAGARMTLRAAYLIVAFSAISVELRNPRVLGWFIRRGFGEVSAALGVAFQALPDMVRMLDHERAMLRHPWRTLSRVLAMAVTRITRAEGGVILVTGERGSGKTTAVESLARTLRATGLTVRGFTAPALFRRGERIGYDLVDLASGERHTLCRTSSPPTGIERGPYRFLPETFRRGAEILSAAGGADLIVIDEVGPLELEGLGWADALAGLLSAPPPALVLTVRPSLADELARRFGVSPALVWHAGRDDDGELAAAARRAALYTGRTVLYHEGASRTSA